MSTRRRRRPPPPPKRKLPSITPHQPSSSSSSLSSLSPLESPAEDDSEDDILAFLKPKQSSALISTASAALRPPAPKLTMADIHAKLAKNKARDNEISRAQKLFEQSETSKQIPTKSASAALNTYLETQEGVPAILGMLKKPTGKADQLPSWSFFGDTPTVPQILLEELCASIRASTCIRPFLGSDPRDLGVENIRDFLVSGAMVDCLGSCSSSLDPPLCHLFLDTVCAGIDEDVSFSCLTLVTTLRTQFEPILDQSRIVRIFELIGGSKAALDPTKPLETDSQDGRLSDTTDKGEPDLPRWWNISLVLKMLSRLLQGLSDDVFRVVWGLVVRLSLDERRMKERRGQPEFLDLVENLLQQLECRGYQLTRTILSEIYASVIDRTLQVQLLGLLPATSGFSHDFRKRLARAFFSRNTIYLGPEPGPGILMGSIIAALASKEIRISKGESHTQLQNIIDIINIAVDDGRWCANVVERTEKGTSENLLDKLILHLNHSKEFIQAAGFQLNIEKSNAKDSFAKLIIRLEAVRQRKRGTQTVMDRYFRPNLE
ncbi:hypothetical protein TWF730_004840 [Orbilia blumenaviensis]